MSDKTHKKHIEALYNAHADAIFKYVFFKTSDREKSLDITHDTFVKTWEAVSAGTEIQNHKAYLYRTAEHLIIDWYRKKKSISLDKFIDEGIDFPLEADTTQDLINKLDSEQVGEIIKNLEPEYKAVISMRYLEEMSVKEIASILDEKENTISVRIYRALEKLRSHIIDFERKGGNHRT